MRRLRFAAAAALLSLAPIPALAVTFPDTNTLQVGDVVELGPQGNSWEFVANLTKSDGRGSFEFVFNNRTKLDREVRFGVNLNQVAARLDTGLQVSFGDQRLDSLSSRMFDIEYGVTRIAAKASETLTLNFGQAVGWRTGSTAILTFAATVAAVPLPAAGTLLLGAIGGLAALRRRTRRT